MIGDESQDWIVRALFRPTARGGSWSPDEVTAMGMTRRLRERAKKRLGEPVWAHPDTQLALAGQVAQRCWPAIMPVLGALLRHYEGQGRKDVREALYGAMGLHCTQAKARWAGDPASPPSCLLERMLTLHHSVYQPLLACGMLGHLPEWWQAGDIVATALWREVMVGAAKAHEGPLPGPAERWCGLMQALRMENTEAAWDDLDWLLTQRPDLVTAAPAHGEHLPLLVRGLQDEASNARSLDLYLSHGGTLDHEVPTALYQGKRARRDTERRDMEEAWGRGLSRRPAERMPLWLLLAQQGHEAARAWGVKRQFRALERLEHCRENSELLRLSLGSSGDQGDEWRRNVSRRLQQTRAWAHPHSIQKADAFHTGDCHPLWTAAWHAPHLLGRNFSNDKLVYPDLVHALRERLDLQAACNEEGANLWWAVAPRISEGNAAELATLNRLDIRCLPDRHGRGLFFKHPDIHSLLSKAQPVGSSTEALPSGPAAGLAKNPLWLAITQSPDGFFGHGAPGQADTAASLWQHLNESSWFKSTTAQKRACTVLMTFDGVEPETLHPSLRLFVAVVLTLAMGPERVTELGPWMEDPAGAGVDPEHAALAYLKELSPAFRAGLREKNTPGVEAPSMRPRLRT